MWLVKIGALLIGGFFLACEVYGAYDYLLAEQKTVNYVVLAGIGFTFATGLLPLYAGIVWNQGKRLLPVLMNLVLPAVMIFVFVAGLSRTGTSVDTQQGERETITTNRALSESTEKEATNALKEAVEAARVECSVGPPEKRRGPKCLTAEEKRDRAQAAVLRARSELQKMPGPKSDSVGKRISMLSAGYITEKQFRDWQPLFVPLMMSILAAIFFSVGAAIDAKRPVAPTRPDTADAVSAPKAQPAIVLAPPANDEVDPKMVIEFMKARVKIEAGEEVDMRDLLADYTAWCGLQTPPLRPLEPREFVQVLRFVVEKAGIPKRKRGERVYLQNRKLVSR